MVKLTSMGSEREFDVYDVGGQHLGRVVNPAGPPRLGAGAATILLDRSRHDGMSHR
jgi:hypothetical protein